MASKPSSLPRWANVSGAIVVPGLSKQDAGFKTGERPPAQYLNWLHERTYAWLQYLADGALSGAHTFANTVGITGLLTTSGGQNVPTGQAITLAGTADLKHGDRTIAMGAAMFNAAGATSLTTPQNVSSGGVEGGAWRNWAAAPNDVIIGFVPGLKAGDRIRSITYYFNKASSAAALGLNLYKTQLGTPTSIGSLRLYSDTSASASDASRVESAIDSVLAVGEAPFVEVRSVTAAHSFYGCVLTFDRP